MESVRKEGRLGGRQVGRRQVGRQDGWYDDRYGVGRLVRYVEDGWMDGEKGTSSSRANSGSESVRLG